MPRGSSIPTRFSRAAYEPELSRGRRRQQGAYYTPLEVVRLIVNLALEPLLVAEPSFPPRVLDPACGAGEFLVEAAQRLLGRFCPQVTAASLHGWDSDPNAIEVCRRRLCELGLPAASVAQNIGCVDALVENDALVEITARPTSFDCVLANPPYLSIRQLAKSLPPDRIAELRRRYRTARGNFDLYVPFIERTVELLRDGGRCGLVVPNKWATLNYAQACRELVLRETTLEHVIDLSAERVFKQASVYPHVLIFRRAPASNDHEVFYSDGLDTAATRALPEPNRNIRSASRTPGSALPQRLLSPVAISLTSPLDVESRVTTAPLGELCTLSCGTAGFSAQRIARRLLDAEDAGQSDALELADFITSGNIDRYCVSPGNVRYLGRTYTRPKLPLAVAELTERKRELFREPKIVIAGMSRRLEAAWDDRGLALGVQVFAASEIRIDPPYLLALLNSKLLSYLFRARFAAKRLAGGYLAINKGQLEKLPIAMGGDRQTSLAALARRMSCQPTSVLDGQIDHMVYGLYRLTRREIARVEASFGEPSARAA